MKDERLPQPMAKVSCPCGSVLKIDTFSEERRLRCPRCQRLIDVVVSFDRSSKRSKVSIVVPLEALISEGESLGASTAKKLEPPPPPTPRPKTVVRGVFGTCLCGEEFPVDDRELTTIQPCPRCGTKYHVVVKLDRETKKRSAILVPVEGPSTLRPKASPTRAIKKVKAKATEAAAPGTQLVTCPCGQTLAARRKDVAAGLACSSCGRTLRLMEDRDPQTLAPRIRLRPDPKK